MTCFPQEIKTRKSLNMWHYACPPKPMPGRRNKRLGEGEGVAALAGKVLNNRWFGFRFQSLRTLADEKGMAKQHYSKVSIAGACASTGDPPALDRWHRSSVPLMYLGTLGHVEHTEQWDITTTPPIPRQRRGRKGPWFANSPSYGCGLSCKERGQAMAAVIRREVPS